MLTPDTILLIKATILLGFVGALGGGYDTYKLKYSSKFDVIMSTIGGFCVGILVLPLLLCLWGMIYFVIYA